MNQTQIKNLLEDVSSIKETFNINGKDALSMYKKMLKTEYNEYMELKEEKSDVNFNAHGDSSLCGKLSVGQSVGFSDAVVKGIDYSGEDYSNITVIVSMPKGKDASTLASQLLEGIRVKGGKI